MTPQRIQLKRTKGWRKPEGAITVARPTRFGNPFCVGDRTHYRDLGVIHAVDIPSRDAAVALYKMWLGGQNFIIGETAPNTDEIQTKLRGHDLACWCALDVRCHADVLLEIANRPAGGTE